MVEHASYQAGAAGYSRPCSLSDALFVTLSRYRLKHAMRFWAPIVAVLATQLAYAPACPAQAPDMPAEEAGVTVFPAAFYAPGEPVSALDVVNRTPGFAFDRGNQRLRGLESAAGNVLVDGRWPTIKANTLSEVLEAIPFAVIERVELIRAEAADFDTMGRQVVLNVVRARGGEATLVGEAGVRKYTDNDRDIGAAARLEYARPVGPVNLDGGLLYKSEQVEFGVGEGPYTLRTADSETLRSGRFDREDWEKTLQATAGGSYATEGIDLGVNLTAKSVNLILDQFGDYATPAGAPRTEVVDILRRSKVFEIGSDVTFTFAATRRLNVKLLRRSGSQSRDSSLELEERKTQAVSDFAGSETIARAIFGWDPLALLDLEFGAEAAFNELDSSTELEVGGARLELPNDNIAVEENRYEAFAKTTVRVSSKLYFEGSLAFENSTLTQSGDANLVKRFDFVKPRIAAAWTLDDATDIRLRVEKVVGQLDFFTFAASPSLDSGIFSAGNADLEPGRVHGIRVAVGTPVLGRSVDDPDLHAVPAQELARLRSGRSGFRCAGQRGQGDPPSVGIGCQYALGVHRLVRGEFPHASRTVRFRDRGSLHRRRPEHDGPALAGRLFRADMGIAEVEFGIGD